MSKTNVSLLLLFVVFFAGATSARANESIMRSAAVQQPTPPEPQRKQERKEQALYPPRRRICCFNDMKPACGAFAEDEGWAAEDPTEFQWIADDYDLDHDDWEDDGESVPAWFEAAYDACTRIWITGEARELPSACAGAAARCLFAAMMTMLLVIEDTLQSSRIRLTWRDRAADAAGMIFMATCATGILLVGLSGLLAALTFMALILCSDILRGAFRRTGILAERLSSIVHAQYSYIRLLLAPWPPYRSPLHDQPFSFPAKRREPHVLIMHGRMLMRTGIDLVREIAFRVCHPSVLIVDLMIAINAMFEDDYD